MVEIRMFKTELRPSIRASLKWPDGTTVSLEGCTAKFQLVERDTGMVILNKAATVVSPPTNGIVQYDWVAGDTIVQKSKYKIRIEVAFADAKLQTFPRADNFFVIFSDKEGT